MFLPRQSKGLLARKTNGLWVASYGSPETPVMGVTRYDAYRFLDWRNKKALESGEVWTYTIPTEKQWEKAARGVDGRLFPWGNRFDFLFAVLKYRKKYPLYGVPGCFEPRDMSPYSVADMAGSRNEWTREETPPGSNRYIVRGGAWAFMNGMFSRCATRNTKPSTYFTADIGFRLIAVPKK